MRLAALHSGGKDSTLAVHLAEQMGHEVVRLVTMLPEDPDSWLFHTPNLHVLPLLAESMGKPLTQQRSREGEEGEMEALWEALSSLDVDGVLIGAVASDYQWDRVNGVCEELELPLICPLWRKSPLLVMEELLSSGVEAIIVAVAAEGLDGSWLGRRLDEEALRDLLELEKKHGVSITGEGGEYESLTLDSPLQSFPIEILAQESRMGSLSGILKVTEFRAGVREEP